SSLNGYSQVSPGSVHGAPEETSCLGQPGGLQNPPTTGVQVAMSWDWDASLLQAISSRKRRISIPYVVGGGATVPPITPLQASPAARPPPPAPTSAGRPRAASRSPAPDWPASPPGRDRRGRERGRRAPRRGPRSRAYRGPP